MAPRLGELAVAAVASDTVGLSWTVAQGSFDSFLVQYKDVQGQPQAVPVGGHLREISISGLDPARKYKFLLFGLQDEKRHGPVSAEAKTREWRREATFGARASWVCLAPLWRQSDFPVSMLHTPAAGPPHLFMYQAR